MRVKLLGLLLGLGLLRSKEIVGSNRLGRILLGFTLILNHHLLSIDTSSHLDGELGMLTKVILASF